MFKISYPNFIRLSWTRLTPYYLISNGFEKLNQAIQERYLQMGLTKDSSRLSLKKRVKPGGRSKNQQETQKGSFLRKNKTLSTMQENPQKRLRKISISRMGRLKSWVKRRIRAKRSHKRFKTWLPILETQLKSMNSWLKNIRQSSFNWRRLIKIL